MDKVVQRLIEQFAALPITPETSIQREASLDQLADHNIHMQGSRWIHFESGADLGPVTPEGSVRAMSKKEAR